MSNWPKIVFEMNIVNYPALWDKCSPPYRSYVAKLYSRNQLLKIINNHSPTPIHMNQLRRKIKSHLASMRRKSNRKKQSIFPPTTLTLDAPASSTATIPTSIQTPKSSPPPINVKGEPIAISSHLDVKLIKPEVIMDTERSLMEFINKETPLRKQSIDEMDTDEPICIVHLKVERSENVEIIEGYALKDLKKIKSEKIIDGEYITQGLIQEDIGRNGLIHAKHMEQKVEEDGVDIEITRFIDKKDHNPKLFNQNRLSLGKDIKTELSEELNRFEKYVQTSEADLHQELEIAAENVKQEKEEDQVEPENNTFINQEYKKQKLLKAVDNDPNRLPYVKTMKVELSEEVDIFENDVLTCGEDLKEEQVETESMESEKCKGAVLPANYLLAGYRRFECEICKKRFSRKGGLKRHLAVHTGEKHYKCEICKLRFVEKCTLNRHFKIHTREKPLECKISQQNKCRKDTLDRDLTEHITKNDFECEICQRRYAKRYTLIIHLRTHTREKPFECEFCRQKFTVKSHLNVHLRKHTGVKPFDCEICHHKFTAKSDLNRHLRTHSEMKPFLCDICQQGFSEKSTLNVHFRKHTGEKPFECEICNHKFAAKSDLSKHLRIHTGEKPFECQTCKRRFARKTDFNKHLRIHTGVKPFECKICQHKANAKSDLNKHLRTHAKNKSFVC